MKQFNEIGKILSLQGELAVVFKNNKKLGKILGSFKGVDLEITVKKLRKNRSNNQNRWLWGVAYVTIAYFIHKNEGNRVSKEAIHAHTLQYILDNKLRVEYINGQEVFIADTASSRNLSTQEFCDMKDKLQEYWGSKGCVIPDPVGNNFLSDYIKNESSNI